MGSGLRRWLSKVLACQECQGLHNSRHRNLSVTPHFDNYTVTMAPNTDISTRALIVALKSPTRGKTTAEVAEKTGLTTRQVNKIYARAIERGFDPNHATYSTR
jgi:hypothetical protein